MLTNQPQLSSYGTNDNPESIVIDINISTNTAIAHSNQLLFTPKKPQKQQSELLDKVQLALASIAGSATSLPIYPVLSWKTGLAINAALKIENTNQDGMLPPSALPIPLTTAVCSTIANVCLSTDKMNDLMKRLPDVAGLLKNSFSNWGNFGHLLADLFFVAASAIGSISLDEITYETYADSLLKFALIPAGLIALGRVVIGTSALVDLKNNILWWINVLKEPHFKAKEQLILLLNDIEALIQKLPSDEVEKLKAKLEEFASYEELIIYLKGFAKSHDIKLRSLSLLNPSLWSRLVIFLIIGIPAAVIYYGKATAGISHALDITQNHWMTMLFSVLSILPTVALQGNASQKAIYDYGARGLSKLHDCYTWLRENCSHENLLYILNNYRQIAYDYYVWSKEQIKPENLKYLAKTAFFSVFNIYLFNTLISIGSAAATQQIVIMASGGLLGLLILYSATASPAAGLTNKVSMDNLAARLTARPTETQKAIAAEMGALKDFLNELSLNNATDKINTLATIDADLSEDVIIDMSSADATLELEDESTNLLNSANVTPGTPSDQPMLPVSAAHAHNRHIFYHHRTSSPIAGDDSYVINIEDKGLESDHRPARKRWCTIS